MTDGAPELIYVSLPEPLGPIDRGAKYEDPIIEQLERLGLGEVTGAGTGLGEVRPDGTRPIESCGIDVETLDLRAARASLRELLPTLGCPPGTHLEYQISGQVFKDAFDGKSWVLQLADEKRANSLLEVLVSKSSPDGDRFVVSAPVAAPAEEVYALLDWADERNKWRQSGDTVTVLDEEGRQFRLVVSYMPDLQFDYLVEEASKPRIYACTCVPTPSVGHLERSHEHYSIDSAGEDECVVTYTMTAYFEPGLNDRQTAEVIRNMTVAAHNTLAKLKANAEHGVGTPEALEATKLMPL